MRKLRLRRQFSPSCSVSSDAGPTSDASDAESDADSGSGCGDNDQDGCVDSSKGDYRLAAGSPCIDAANGDIAPSNKLEGNARVDAPVNDSGVGSPTYVDMGAYEFSP